MASRIQIRGGTLAQWLLADPIIADREIVYERDTNRLKIGNGVDVFSLLPYAYSFVDLADATETEKGIAEAADDTEMQNGTDVGATGAFVFVRPSKLRVYRDMSETTPSLGGSTLTCNCAGKIESRFKYSTITSNTTVVFSNKTNSQLHSLVVALTGSNIVLTFESDTRMARYNESAAGWNATTKALTVSSTVAGDLHEFALLKTGSIYVLRYDGPIRP